VVVSTTAGRSPAMSTNELTVPSRSEMRALDADGAWVSTP
jgi:hypothetical protein